jgi:alkylated DNA repair dioxygenase AlkB
VTDADRWTWTRRHRPRGTRRRRSCQRISLSGKASLTWSAFTAATRTQARERPRLVEAMRSDCSAELDWLRERCAALMGREPEEVADLLVTRYPPGAGIGWHRDAPQFGDVGGVSLQAASRMRFRRGRPRAWQTAELPLEPRSAYLLSGPARTQWQHHIPRSRRSGGR